MGFPVCHALAESPHTRLLHLSGPRTVESVVAHLRPTRGVVLRSRVAAAGLQYPPQELTLLVLKEERLVEVWGRAAPTPEAPPHAGWKRLHTYPVLAASGGPGPKLRAGDHQVPEGSYRIPVLNPNSLFHLSMKVDYPNALDRAQARRDGRTNPGRDIFIHGSDVSLGCIALGDAAIEELFLLVAETGQRATRVIMVPRDLRTKPAPDTSRPWIAALYRALAAQLAALR